MAGLYDLMLLLDPTAPEERRAAAISEAESLIGSGGEPGVSQGMPTTGPRLTAWVQDNRHIDIDIDIGDDHRVDEDKLRVLLIRTSRHGREPAQRPSGPCCG